MNIMLWILTWVGHLSVLTAICCLSWHIVMEFYAIRAREWDKTLTMDNAAWLGLAYFGVWMACMIGKIWV